MSQLRDLANVVNEIGNENGWCVNTRTNNLLQILGALQWDVVDEYPRLEDGTTDYKKLYTMEFEEAKSMIELFL